jgi:3-hydroxyacyl-[acyl-carrier-protein] dehydratase
MSLLAEDHLSSDHNRRPGLSASEVMELMPQKYPFRYVDAIREIDESHVVAQYTFKDDEWFYKGHFPDGAVTPGVILLEAMAQVGLVLQGLYLLGLHLTFEEIKRYRAVFTEAQAEWLEPVRPGETVVITSQLKAWRQQRIRAVVRMVDSQERIVAVAQLAGKGIEWPNASS